VVAKIQWLGRGGLDAALTNKMLPTRRIEAMVFQPGKPDLASLAGRTMLTMVASVLKTEGDLLIEHTNHGIEPATTEGKNFGCPSAVRRTEGRRAAPAGRRYPEYTDYPEFDAIDNHEGTAGSQ
jgi:DNA invertase Pin-like site-specific DNA recombinase